MYSINHIKISGSQQLATDIGFLLLLDSLLNRYLSNVISAFGIGNSKVIIALKETLALSDPGSVLVVTLKNRFITTIE